MKRIACSRANGDATAQKSERRPGGQPGNSNAWRHGRFSRARLEGRKLSLAQMKVLARAAHLLGLVAGRCRVRPLRMDQIHILAALRPKDLSLAEAVGLNPPTSNYRTYSEGGRRPVDNRRCHTVTGHSPSRSLTPSPEFVAKVTDPLAAPGQATAQDAALDWPPARPPLAPTSRKGDSEDTQPASS